jgi:DNA-binding transcriptional MerR regulator
MMYTIKEVAVKTGISAHTLRFYEKEGIMTLVKRDNAGNRVYDEQNLEWLDFVVALRSTGMPLGSIKRYLELYQQGDSTIHERKEIMRNHKVKVEEQMALFHKYLEKINYKLALYDVMEKELKTMP